GARLPRLELLGVAALAGVRSDVGGLGREQLARGAPVRAQLRALGVRERSDLRVGDARMEGRVVEAERMRRIVTDRADGLIVAVLHEARREMRAAASVTGFAADVLEVARAAGEVVA